MIEVLLNLLSWMHWIAPKLLAISIIYSSTKVNTRAWMYPLVPYGGIGACYLLSIFLEFIFQCTVYLVVKEYYLQLILQVIWWIYLVDLLSEPSLYYFTVPVVIYLYCLASTALIASEFVGIFSLLAIVVSLHLILFIVDFVVALTAQVDNVGRLCDIHIPLMLVLYVTIIFNTLNVNSHDLD